MVARARVVGYIGANAQLRLHLKGIDQSSGTAAGLGPQHTSVGAQNLC
jgi:hypothetical protein